MTDKNKKNEDIQDHINIISECGICKENKEVHKLCKCTGEICESCLKELDNNSKYYNRINCPYCREDINLSKYDCCKSIIFKNDKVYEFNTYDPNSESEKNYNYCIKHIIEETNLIKDRINVHVSHSWTRFIIESYLKIQLGIEMFDVIDKILLIN